MLKTMPRARVMGKSSKGDEIAASAASSARVLPLPCPMPMRAVPIAIERRQRDACVREGVNTKDHEKGRILLLTTHDHCE